MLTNRTSGLTHATQRRLPRPAHSRRGTVLLMVIGVLALMAIIAVVYAALGRSERSTSAALAKAEHTDALTQDIAGYIAGVVGDSVFARYPEFKPTDTATPPFNTGNLEVEWRIKAFDYPGVDDRALSVFRGNASGNPSTQGVHMFNNTGSFTLTPGLAAAPVWFPPQSGSVANPANPRRWTTPWLASTEPTSIERLAGVAGPNETLSPGAVPGRSVSNTPHRLIRDWGAISNIAPSGNFVNLANLRGNFDAESGFGLDNNGNPRMSARLTLFQPDGTLASAPANQDPDLTINTMVRWDGRAVRLNRPADWTINQLHLFRPMVDVTFAPSDPGFLFNGYADADGDGYADSRWCELRRLTVDPTNTNDYLAEALLTAIGAGRSGGDLRYFVAARIIDNSSLVNVNVATDFHREPTPDAPPGLTPADVDLRRLLTLYDVPHFFSRYQNPTGFTWDDLPYSGLQPIGVSSTVNYSTYRTSVTADNLNLGYEIGIAGYAALREALARGTLRTDRGDQFFSAGNQNNVLTVQPLTATERLRYFDSVALLSEGVREGDSPQNNAYVESYTKRAAQSLFTLADELELRVYNGLNDDQTTSRLEGVLGGRFENAEFLSPLRDKRSLALERFGRDLPEGSTDPNADRAKIGFLVDPRRLLTTISGSRPIVDASESSVLATGLKLKLDVTPLLTRIREGEYLGDEPLANGATLSGTDIQRNRDLQSERYDSIRRIFTAYVDALAPFADRRASWEPRTPADNWLLAYGGTSEYAMRVAMHLALNLADSHDKDKCSPRAVDATVNADVGGVTAPNRLVQKQRTDDDHVPTAMTLTVTRDAIDERQDPTAANNRLYLIRPNQPNEIEDLFPWPALFCVTSQSGVGGLALPDRSKHPVTSGANSVTLTDDIGGNRPVIGITNTVPQPSGSGGNGAERVIGYGVEPQPFVVDVTMHSIAADAATGAGGDADGDDIPAVTGVPGNPPPTAYVTLVPKRDLANADFVCDILTFTLHNPFDERVYLYRATGIVSNVNRPRFYLEYANRFYIFAEQSDTNPPPGGVIGVRTANDVFLEPGETRVFYVTNPGRLSDVADRIQNLLLNRAYSADDFRAWLRKEFGSNIADDPMVQVDPRSFEPLPYPADSFTLNVDPVDLPTEPQTPPQTVGGSGPTLQQVNIDLLGAEDLESGRGFSTTTPARGRDLPDNVPLNGLLGYGQAIPQSTGVAMLWRVMREPANSAIAVGDETALDLDPKRQNRTNDIVNDLLADRLRDPAYGPDPTIHKFANDIDAIDALGTGLGSSPTWNNGGPNRTDCSAAPTQQNFGVVVRSFARFSRPFDPGLGSTGSALSWRGYLPAWCLESKIDRDSSTAWHSPRNSAAGTWSLNWRFVQEDQIDRGAGTPTTQDVCGYFDSGGAVKLDDDAKKPMHARTTGGTPAARILGFNGRVGEPDRPYDQVAPIYVSAPLVGTGLAERVSLNPGLYSRAGDFLLPLAVGPEYVPGRVPSSSAIFSGGTIERLSQLETQWLTLSEALAMGTGYYSPIDPAAGALPQGSSALQVNVGNDTRDLGGSPNPIVPKTERGGLVLDAWAPHITINSAYQAVGSGVPLALGIMDQFRVAPGISTTDGRGLVRPSAYGGITAIVPGMININTAPPSVLRLMPLVAPEVWGDQSAGTRAIASAWTSPGPGLAVGRCCVSANWGGSAVQICQVLTNTECQSVSGTFTQDQPCDPGDMCGALPQNTTEVRPVFPPVRNVDGVAEPYPRGTPRVRTFAFSGGTWPPTPSTSSNSATFLANSADEAWDIAPTIVAYRDKNVAPTRPINGAGRVGGYARFIDSSSNDSDGRLSAIALPASSSSIGVRGTREQEGFRAVGELLMANQYINVPLVPPATSPSSPVATAANRAVPGGPSQTAAALPNGILNAQSIQRFGTQADAPLLDEKITGEVTTRRNQTSGLAQSGSPLQPAKASRVVSANTLGAKLAVANAMSNIATVRSDIFTAYFIVHGYSRADVESLSDDQPMVPSVAKRFVMVIDRSNVVRKGDKPKVLLFKEVPLE